uniref:Uncharacterized protein n=1 Tax=Micromonas pusilla TaxID=38833 RepID=A0A7R9TNU8_MICPS|mmetsp:Transcript_4946/g.17679  ORF Transcript_4946/g.17679 Transcript_4946/m.17679 type:complete len:265 (+) Transcript_4946:175-969(+)
MSVLHRITRHPITKIASKNASAMSSDAAPFKIRSVSYESPSLGGSIPRAANSAASENCVTSISSPIAKHPPRIVRLTASSTVPSYASRSYALAASAPGIQHAASFAPCDSAGTSSGSDRQRGTHGAGTSHDGRGTPSARTTMETNTGTVVTTSASAMGRPRSSMRADVNLALMAFPKFIPALNSSARFTFSLSSFSFSFSFVATTSFSSSASRFADATIAARDRRSDDGDVIRPARAADVAVAARLLAAAAAAPAPAPPPPKED